MLRREVSTRQPDDVAAGIQRLNDRIAHALAGCGEVATKATTLVVVGGGWSLSTAPMIDLGPLGVPWHTPAVSAPAGPLGNAITHVEAARRALTGDAAILALHLHEHLGSHVPLRVLTVPSDASRDELTMLVEHLVAEGEGLVVAATDLASTLTVASPGYIVDGAVEFDAEVVRVCDGDAQRLLEGLDRLGAHEARRVGARGWSPLRLLATGACATGTQLQALAYEAPRGVGQLVVAHPQASRG